MRPGKVVLYRSRNGWRWRIVAANGLILANSGQGYSRLIDCTRALNRVMFDAQAWPMESRQ